METFYQQNLNLDRAEIRLESLLQYDHVKLRRGEYTPASPFTMKVSEGKRFYDLVGFQDTSNWAISEKLYSLLIQYKITGWKAFELEIKDVELKYYGFQITGRCGELIDPDEPGFYTGLKFDISSWDGSDFFCPGESVVTLCTQKVKEILVGNKISNCEITDINLAESFSSGKE